MTQLSDLQGLLDEYGRRLDTHDTAIDAAIDVGELADLVATVAALTRRVVDLELANEPAPPPLADTVTVGASLGTSRTLLGWTSVHDEDTQTAILAKASNANNVHTLGFGTNTDPQPGPGAPYDWRGLDARFADLPTGNKRVLTLCGCPPHMRTPKPGASPDPVAPAAGAQLSSLFDYSFPHSSWFEEASDLYVAALDRYRPYVAQMWNEGKGNYFSTKTAGSLLVQPEWGIPALTGSNRWWVEGLTALSNMVYRKKQAVCSDVLLASPYYVVNTYGDTQNIADHADGPMPYDWHGPWGHGDRKVLRAYLYFIEHGDTDLLAIDVKTSNKVDGVSAANQWDGLAKIPAFQTWLRDLDPVQYPKAAGYADRLWAAEWYARGRTVDLGHAEEAATIAHGYIQYGLKVGLLAAMMWGPQGHGVDPADSNPLGLWTDAPALAETELVAVCAGLVEHFPPGAPLYEVAAEHPDIGGIANPTTLCLVSRSAGPVDVVVDGQPVILAPFEVAFIPRVA